MDAKKSNLKTIVCYGEVLWDIFPDATKPGGAPMNVAYHLKKFGIDSQMISSVGSDSLGEALLNQLQDWNIPTENCQVNENFRTGFVEAIAGEDHEMTYVIHEDVAWDQIQPSTAYDTLVEQADAFIFGTLVCRNERSRNTLYKLLDKATYKVFDINLRPPFYSQEIIEHLLGQCNLLKLNHSELELIISWYTSNHRDEASAVQFLQEKFDIGEVIVTKGSRGATYYDGNQSHTSPACKVEVKDTVGAGDSFLAAFLSKKIQNESIETSMSYATALGAFVASNEGACPAYTIDQVERFANLNTRVSA
ncbi:carbohydrate kinase family protein [Mangrovibacterium marinum]|uniref:Fructokinase n=1 Tax=Mangrovibacterium marinum TaxID=1639118 RepID=A0A2T5C576_9BACT|nr:carbohydrate kinase [Mangrovibacterium marinum]PTN10032.1 fructokinase [Mangrovibacterium marinum]